MMMSCNLQGICSWKGARCFSLSHRHALLQGATSDLQKAFGFGVHPTPLPHPDASHQFWVHMAVGSGRKTTWYGRLWQSPHRIDPTCVNQNMFFLIRFFIQNTPLEWLQASWRQPNLWLKDGLHGAPSVIKIVFWPGDCHKMLQEPLRLNEEEAYNKMKHNWQHESQGRQFYICINCINIYFN